MASAATPMASAAAAAIDLPHCVLAMVFGDLAVRDLRAVAVVCSAWHAAEAEMEELLWERFAPAAFPAHLAKRAALNQFLFDNRTRRCLNADRLAFESPSHDRLSLSTSFAMPRVLLRALSLLGSVGASSEMWAARRYNVLIAGPDGSGKTSVLDAFCNRPAGWAVRARHHAKDLHVETVTSGGTRVQLMECGAQLMERGAIVSYSNHRAMKRSQDLLSGIQGIIYVCDGQAMARYGTCADEARVLSALLAHPELAGLPLLVLASKQDLTPRAPCQVCLDLDLLSYTPGRYPPGRYPPGRPPPGREPPGRRWRIQPCSLVGNTDLVTSERAELRTGLKWLVQAMRQAARAGGAASLHATLQMMAMPAPVCWVAREMWEAGGAMLHRVADGEGVASLSYK
jgi:signal recognition particle receptor subunit beta